MMAVDIVSGLTTLALRAPTLLTTATLSVEAKDDGHPSLRPLLSSPTTLSKKK